MQANVAPKHVICDRTVRLGVMNRETRAGFVTLKIRHWENRAESFGVSRGRTTVLASLASEPTVVRGALIQSVEGQHLQVVLTNLWR